jgi:glucokinase
MRDVALGVDVGGTKSLALVLDRRGQVMGESRAASAASSPEELIESLVCQVVGLCDDLGLDVCSVPLGVGLAGMVDHQGRLAFSPHLSSVSGTDVAAALERALSREGIAVDNDANLAALAEGRWGAASSYSHYVAVTLGTGIGGGIVANGVLQRGANGFAGEIGHMSVVARGELCACGARGCWERYVSGDALTRRAREAVAAGTAPRLARRFGANLVSEDVAAAAGEADAEALALLEEMGWWLAAGLANLAAILDVSCFVVGGGLSALSHHLLPPARQRLGELLEGASARGDVEVLDAALGARAGAMGAALVAGGWA